jgi:hypothetical protein
VGVHAKGSANDDGTGAAMRAEHSHPTAPAVDAVSNDTGAAVQATANPPDSSVGQLSYALVTKNPKDTAVGAEGITAVGAEGITALVAKTQAPPNNYDNGGAGLAIYNAINSSAGIVINSGTSGGAAPVKAGVASASALPVPPIPKMNKYTGLYARADDTGVDVAAKTGVDALANGTTNSVAIHAKGSANDDGTGAAVLAEHHHPTAPAIQANNTGNSGTAVKAAVPTGVHALANGTTNSVAIRAEGSERRR